MSREKALRALEAFKEALDDDDYHGLEWALEDIQAYLEEVIK